MPSAGPDFPSCLSLGMEAFYGAEIAVICSGIYLEPCSRAVPLRTCRITWLSILSAFSHGICTSQGDILVNFNYQPDLGKSPWKSESQWKDFLPPAGSWACLLVWIV